MISNIDNFIELMRRKELHLPRRWNDGDFQHELNYLFEVYTSSLSRIVDKDDQKLIKDICKSVLESVEHYYNGHTSTAFSTFSKVMKILMSRPFMIYQKSGEMITLSDFNDELRLYRIRNVYENKIYNKSDIFHTPFNLRSKIGTCRYSIAGYPCLYLATNLELCLIETPKLDNSQITLASKFQINRSSHVNGGIDIKVIELGVKPQHFLGKTQEDNFTYDIDRTVDRLNEINLEDSNIMNNYLLWYPVIAAASFIRASKNDPFASEYIIPQLIMEWIRLSAKNEEYYGIRYFSSANERASEIGMNYVFPAYYDKSSNNSHCSILAKVFKLTEPIMLHNYLDEFDCQQHLDNCNELDKINL